jgi:hypothetical protein
VVFVAFVCCEVNNKISGKDSGVDCSCTIQYASHGLLGSLDVVRVECGENCLVGLVSVLQVHTCAVESDMEHGVPFWERCGYHVLGVFECMPAWRCQNVVFHNPISILFHNITHPSNLLSTCNAASGHQAGGRRVRGPHI